MYVQRDIFRDDTRRVSSRPEKFVKEGEGGATLLLLVGGDNTTRAFGDPRVRVQPTNRTACEKQRQAGRDLVLSVAGQSGQAPLPQGVFATYIVGREQ